MIRNILTIIVFFFGPAILLFMLRNFLLVLKVWLQMRRQRPAEPEIIDVTPRRESRTPLWFKVVAVLAGVLSAWLAWQRLDTGSEKAMRYVPAYMDQQGKIVPGHLEPANAK
ncbi:MAG TPA: hypothetical protein VNI58_05595 [Mariprofundaceae bacterium]|nr:hypothetical protein [Mariprofundaceae bacterium]